MTWQSYWPDGNCVTDRVNRSGAALFEALDPDAILLSALTIGEVRRGIESVRRRDSVTARALERWLSRILADHRDRIVPVDLAIAEEWGRLNVPDRLPVIDGLLAATARVYGLTFATRNVKDVKRTGTPMVNPFEG